MKLNKNVNIVSESASSSILCKKKGQLAISLAENVVLKLIKISFEEKVFLFISYEKGIRGQSSWINTWQCVPLFTSRWFVLRNFKNYSSYPGRIFPLLSVAVKVTLIVLLLNPHLYSLNRRQHCRLNFNFWTCDLVKNNFATKVKCNLGKIECSYCK